MPRCCGGASCSCAIEGGPHITVAGTGTAGDPIVVSADVAVNVTDTSMIDLTKSGLGTVASPWAISAQFAPTSKLNDLGDVNTSAPTNGQVVAWNASAGEWRAVAPTTAAAGSVTTDGSLSGDGSAGTPLQVREDPARFLATATAGLGLSDSGVNSLVRHFADDTARDSASPAPALNTMSTLDSNPGQIDYWTGSGWDVAGQFEVDIDGDELYQMSGPYTGVERVTLMVRNFITTTDDLGVFDVLPATDLVGRAGVLSAQVTPSTGTLGLGAGVPWVPVLAGDSGALRATAYRLDDGSPLPALPIAGSVTAILY